MAPSADDEDRTGSLSPEPDTLPHAPAGEAAAGLPAELEGHPRYRVLQPLGQGGMGTVYLAEHLVMGRRVALKTIHTRLVAGPETVARFRREVQAAAKLAHPNIVTAHDADEAGGLHFLVMEYVEGVTLAEYVARKGPLPVAQACTAALQVALGLQHAHEQGLVHRDIKPHNLMLTRKGQVKILDFGLAHFARQEGAQDTGLTGSGVILGTADYIAPEQTTSGRAVDIRADIYSLGCTLFFLLTGRAPYPGGTVIDKMYRHATEPPPALHEARPGLPEGLAAAVAKMMAKRPEERYQTPADAARALRPFAAPGRAPAGPPEPDPFRAIAEAATTPPDPTIVARRATRKKAPGWRTPALVAGGVLAVAASVVVIVLAVSPGGRKGTAEPGGPAANGRLVKSDPAYLARTPNVLTDRIRTVEGVTDFREVHGVSRQELLNWQHDLGADLRIICLSSQKGVDEPRFSAVAVRERKPLESHFFPGLTPAEGGKKNDDVPKAEPGYRLFGSCPYLDQGQIRVNQLWVRDDAGSVAFWWGTFDWVKEKVEANRGGSLRPVCLDAIPNKDGLELHYVSGPSERREWKLFAAASVEEVDEAPAMLRPQGYRVDFLSVYPSGQQFKFIVVAVENPERADWWCKAGLTTREYEDLLIARKREGMFPSAVASYGSLADPRYAALWVRYRPVEPPPAP